MHRCAPSCSKLEMAALEQGGEVFQKGQLRHRWNAASASRLRCPQQPAMLPTQGKYAYRCSFYLRFQQILSGWVVMRFFIRDNLIESFDVKGNPFSWESTETTFVSSVAASFDVAWSWKGSCSGCLKLLREMHASCLWGDKWCMVLLRAFLHTVIWEYENRNSHKWELTVSGKSGSWFSI